MGQNHFLEEEDNYEQPGRCKFSCKVLCFLIFIILLFLFLEILIWIFK
jgi:hypothetical protein